MNQMQGTIRNRANRKHCYAVMEMHDAQVSWLLHALITTQKRYRRIGKSTEKSNGCDLRVEFFSLGKTVMVKIRCVSIYYKKQIRDKQESSLFQVWIIKVNKFIQENKKLFSLLLAHFSSLPEVECLARESHLGWPPIATLVVTICFSLQHTSLVFCQRGWTGTVLNISERTEISWPGHTTLPAQAR